MAYELVIKNGTIVEGTGKARFGADVAVHSGQIVGIGTLDATGASTIDAAGKIVCPGFIDPHTHYDAPMGVYGDPAFKRAFREELTLGRK